MEHPNWHHTRNQSHRHEKKNKHFVKKKSESLRPGSGLKSVCAFRSRLGVVSLTGYYSKEHRQKISIKTVMATSGTTIDATTPTQALRTYKRKNRAIPDHQSEHDSAYTTFHLRTSHSQAATAAPRGPYERRRSVLKRARRPHIGPFLSRTICFNRSLSV